MDSLLIRCSLLLVTNVYSFRFHYLYQWTNWFSTLTDGFVTNQMRFTNGWQFDYCFYHLCQWYQWTNWFGPPVFNANFLANVPFGQPVLFFRLPMCLFGWPPSKPLLPLNFIIVVPCFSIEVSSTFCSLASLSSSSSLLPFHFPFAFSAKPRIKIDSQFQFCNIRTTKSICGRLETGHHFEIYQHSLHMIKDGGHEVYNRFMHSVQCVVVSCSKDVSFFKSTSMKISQGRYPY